MTKNETGYYEWFTKFINVIIYIFFILAIISTLFVFTSFSNGALRLLLFIFLIIIYCLIFYLCKERVIFFILETIRYLTRISRNKMVLQM